jgi:dethiobiotin synthetase
MKHNNLFITGIGTGVGKTIISAIVTEALGAQYWKPIQAGFEEGTDTQTVASLVSNETSIFHPEVYQLALPASPHIAAKKEGIEISLNEIIRKHTAINITDQPLVIEGAGGLMVPLNADCFVTDLVKQLHAGVILVSRNYLGSINHSLLTAAICKQQELPVLGWIFNDQFMEYEEEIAAWSGFPIIGSIPYCDHPNKQFVLEQAALIAPKLAEICSHG